MKFSEAKGPGDHHHKLGAEAAAIPGMYLAKGDLAGAQAALERLLEAAGKGVLPASAKDRHADAEGNLWMIRAGHLFAKAGGDAELAKRLLEFSRHVIQAFISAKGVGRVLMDNGGLLLPATDGKGASGIRLNALWYSALESTAEDLKKAGDRTGDHFERLAGRFRRTFAKNFWCEEHSCVCAPETRGEGRHGNLPDADQLLLTVLPESPIPRTKQRQMVQAVRERGAMGEGTVGIWVNHPVHGRVESAVHRAWLAMGFLNTADNRAAGVNEAQAIMWALSPVVTAGQGVAQFYREGKAMGEADLVTTAEVMGAMGQLRQ